MLIQEILKQATNRLEKNKNWDKQESSFMARRLLAYVLKQDKVYLTIHSKDEIEAERIKEYHILLEEIEKGKPIQYILQNQEFMGFGFYVDENVLIPQPDTEILVEEVLHTIEKEYRNKKVKILDIGTGSGAIGISIKKVVEEMKKNIKVNTKLEVEVSLLDISAKALAVAKKNAETLKVEIKEYIVSNMFEQVKEKYDIIVSNPPYIETKVIENLEKEVQAEPILALDGGEDGLDCYRVLVEQASSYLLPEGYLCLEIGYNQQKKLINLLKDNKQYGEIVAKQDLQKKDRIIISKMTNLDRV